jgi:hypothetical protein
MHGIPDLSSPKRLVGSMVRAVCACGTEFTYRRGPKPKQICVVCEARDQRVASSRRNLSHSNRNAELPKEWGCHVRRSYVIAESATRKLIPLIARLPLDQAHELLGHLLAQSLIRPERD